MRRQATPDGGPGRAAHRARSADHGRGGRRRVERARVAFVTLAALAATPAAAHAQVSILKNAPALAARPPASLSVTVSSGAAQSIASLQDNSLNQFPSPVSVTVSWSDVAYPTNLCVVGYFADPARALASGATGIPSSRVEGRVTTTGGPGPWTPFTQNGCSFGVGTTGGSLRLLTALLNGNGAGSGSASIRINLVGQPALPPGTYSGVLNIRAVIQ